MATKLKDPYAHYVAQQPLPQEPVRRAPAKNKLDIDRRKRKERRKSYQADVRAEFDQLFGFYKLAVEEGEAKSPADRAVVDLLAEENDLYAMIYLFALGEHAQAMKPSKDRFRDFLRESGCLFVYNEEEAKHRSA